MKISKIALAIAMASNASLVLADETPKNEDYNRIVIIAERNETLASETANTTTVISAEQIEREQARNIKDLVRYEPGVSVPSNGRFGLTGFKIRGIGGDRVLTLIDGIPVADEFSFGPNLSAGRNFIDLDHLKAVEIVRGSTSSLYGSNALGGTVSLVAKDPIDYIGTHHEGYYASLKSGYSSANSSLHNTATFAAGNDVFQGMFSATHRDLNELKSNGGVADNPQDGNNLSVYGKLVYQPSKHHQFKLILNQLDAEMDTHVASAEGTQVFLGRPGPTTPVVLRNTVNAYDEQKRSSVSLQYRYNGDTVIADDIYLNVYRQTSETTQITDEDRTFRTTNFDYYRESMFNQDNLGVKVQLNKELGEEVKHLISYGIEWDKMETDTRRIGTHRANNNAVPGFRDFDTRDFPNSEYNSQGLFIQDRISFANDTFILVPAVRYDKFDLTPTSDSIFLGGNPGTPTPAGFSESQVTSKLAGLYKINPNWSFFAQYSEGFKAPPMDAINTAFTNLRGGYTTLPNPDLKPESSKGYELGFKHYGDNSYFEITTFNNRYDDFIETLSFRGFNPRTRLLEFQARNVPSVEIRGLEIKGGWDLGSKFSSLEGMKVRYAYALAKGKDKETGAPLNSIDPQQLVAGLGYDATNGKWGAEFITTLSAGFNEGDLSGTNDNSFYAPGYGIFDLIGYYDFSDKFSATWGIYNLTDKKFWEAGETVGRNEGDAALARITQPGRNFAVTLKYEF